MTGGYEIALVCTIIWFFAILAIRTILLCCFYIFATIVPVAGYPAVVLLGLVDVALRKLSGSDLTYAHLCLTLVYLVWTFGDVVGDAVLSVDKAVRTAVQTCVRPVKSVLHTNAVALRLNFFKRHFLAVWWVLCFPWRILVGNARERAHQLNMNNEMLRHTERIQTIEVMRTLLLDPDVDPNIENGDPLCMAILHNRLEIAQLLLADPRVIVTPRIIRHADMASSMQYIRAIFTARSCFGPTLIGNGFECLGRHGHVRKTLYEKEEQSAFLLMLCVNRACSAPGRVADVMREVCEDWNRFEIRVRTREALMALTS